MISAQQMLDEIRRVEMNLSLKESLANRKRVKADYRKQWQVIQALRKHLERKIDER